MKQISMVKAVLKIAVISVTGLLVACSSSSDSSDSGVVSTTGYVVAAPVNGASVLVKDSTGINTIAGPVTTASDGGYTLDPGSARSGTFILESSGGTYTDEASGDQNVNAGMLKAYVDGATLAVGSQMHLTPASTIVHGMVVNHGVGFSEALKKFKDTFGFDADSAVAPADATNPAADATTEELLAGLRAAAFSQLTKDLGLAPSEQFDLLKALAEDLAFGDLDGEGDAGVDIPVTANVMLPVDIHNRFSQALVNFHQDFDEDTNDNTGLTSDQIGTVPFAKVALTSAYKIVYKPGMMDAMEGKTMFKLLITDHNDQPASGSGLDFTLMPMMHMAGHKHSTPMLDCVEIGITGEYDCTVYYLMSSMMGYWDLKVDLDGSMMTTTDIAHFYPTVMMPMGDTAKVTLKGVEDTITNMDGLTVSRSYPIFKESLMGSPGLYNFSVFVAAQETMMSFPAVFVNSMLSGNALVNVIVEISADDGASWILATDGGNGIWSVTGLTLTDGVADEIRVRLTVNDGTVDEMKTTNGLLREVDVNDYQIFTVTP
ncbi:MAG: hypothetical protein IMF17_00695 [Proteobacteria bacterium]|nr:hypothetical protein [Pseudomonadota bacterium]